MSLWLGDLRELVDMVGQEVAVSDWVAIDQQRIDLFAQASGDHQWIHVDPRRAADGPFGRTIAHGFLTLSLGTALQLEMVEIANLGLARSSRGGRNSF